MTLRSTAATIGSEVLISDLRDLRHCRHRSAEPHRRLHPHQYPITATDQPAIMDEKLTHPLPDRSSSTPPQTCQHSVSATMAPRRTRAAVAVLLVFVALYSLYQTATFTSLAISTLAPGIALSGGQRENGFSTKDLVPLEAHIISKCPDTRVCSPTTSRRVIIMSRSY